MPLKVCDFSSWRLSHLTPCQPHSGAMRATWTPMLVMGLVMLICTSARGDATSSKDEKRWFKRMMDIITQVENDAGDGSAQTDVKTERSFRQKLKTKSGEPILEIFPRDLRKKEKIIRHMTGPLYFSSKCRKRVYRLYHNTRDCTIPAYYKRCSRLLTNLARSPRCQEA